MQRYINANFKYGHKIFGGVGKSSYLCHCELYNYLFDSTQIMNRTLLFTIALVAAVFAGCSKDSESMEEQERNNMEQTNALLKEQIVGVWRNGDYWVSFSEDGYNSAFLNVNGEERVDEGNYVLDGDTAKVTNSYFRNTTKYAVSNITENTLTVEITYNFSHFAPRSEDRDIHFTMTFTRSNDIPSERDGGIDGRKFTCEGVYIDRRNGREYDVTQENQIVCVTHIILYWNTFHTDKPTGLMTNDTEGGYRYFVYLAPYIYAADLDAVGEYQEKTPVRKFILSDV